MSPTQVNVAYNTHNTQQTQNFSDDEHTSSMYRLWSQHISFFMAHPVQFFGIFVANPAFRQSVFNAGLTFHPETDPNHPVLINLNSGRFGMAERISALSPPAGIDLIANNTASSPVKSKAPAVSNSNTVAASVPMPTLVRLPNSPLGLPSLQPLSGPLFMPSSGYFDPTSPSANPDCTEVVYDTYPGVVLGQEGMESLTISEHSVGPDEIMLAQVNDRRFDGSDYEFEFFSDGDHPYSGSTKPHAMYSFNGMYNAQRTELAQDGRQKVVSRVALKPMPTTVERKPLSDEAKVELIEQISEIFPDIVPPSAFSDVRNHLLKRLRDIVLAEWPNAELYIYGSAGNGLGLKSADVDMSLCIPRDVSSPRAYQGGDNGSARLVLMRLSDIMIENNVDVLGMFLDARVPVIKMRDRISCLHVDVCVNNMLAVRNTELLKAYVNLDERFRYLCMLVKLWAKRRDLNDAYNGTLSSYAYTLLVIHYLQTLEAPILPCLQRMVNGKPVVADSEIPNETTENGDFKLCNTYFDRSVTQSTYSTTNTDPIHELLVNFFYYYAYTFQYDTDLVSIRLGKRVPRSERGWDTDVLFEGRDNISEQLPCSPAKAKNAAEQDNMSIGRKQNGIYERDIEKESNSYARPPRLLSKHLFCIEDPFDIDHDLSRGMEKAAVTVIRQEMMRAYDILAESGDWQLVCEEFGYG